MLLFSQKNLLAKFFNYSNKNQKLKLNLKQARKKNIQITRK